MKSTRRICMMGRRSAKTITEFDALSDTGTLYSCVKALDTANRLSGSASIKLTKNADIVGYFVIDVPCIVNAAKFASVKYRFYVADKSNIASVSTVFFTSLPFTYDICFVNFVGWQLANGWNTLTIPFSDFTKYGDASWYSIKGLRFTVNLTVDNATEEVNFDKVEFVRG